MKPQNGETVRVHYKGTLSDGSEFDSSSEGDPISFTIGEGTVIPGFEAAVAELEVGDSTTVTIPSAEAYGERYEDAVQTVPLEAFGDSGTPQAGWVIQVQDPNGQTLNALVANVDDEVAILDFNHPLAGQDLTFELDLVEIVGR
ncbi:MAG: peptidylprolyl isomerase [Coriobacteriia bacterium]|nr:peptidylprolyl isomerase [Coriobacteriia bacterium]